MTVLAEWLTVQGNPAAWRALGLVVADDGFVPLMGTSIKIEEGPDAGLVGWAFSGVESDFGSVDPIDGLRTESVAARPPVFAAHPIGASGLDHVVVMTPDLDRTSSAVEAVTGFERKRVRSVDGPGGVMYQGFHRIGRGGLIVEIVQRPEADEGPAAFWGVVLNVDDLDAACAHIGSDLIGDAQDAVQPGRRIATVRREAGLGLPVALMTT